MAPAAEDTLLRYFQATDTRPSDFDLIVTGDLGFEGGSILCELMHMEGMDIAPVFNDCGMMIYNRSVQDTHAGGSGCGCSAVVLCGHILHRFQRGELRRVLFMATGALLSTTSSQQGDSIPGIAHAIVLEADP